jgi:general secretion pathway protein B
MSSILEALKKLEDEKAAKQNGSGHIVGKVVKSGRSSQRQPKWIIPVVMVAVSSLAAFITYLLMVGSTGRSDKALSPPVAYHPWQPAQIQVRPVAPHATESHPESPHTFIRKKVVKPHPWSTPPRNEPVAVTPDAHLPATAPVNRAATPSVTAKATAIPPLKVTGIAWRKDNSERLAIVNGLPVAEGASVGGARVTEIFPDRVRFSLNDRTFDVPLGNSSDENP